MDLILWRHAEAEDGYPDAERKLTGRGKRQAERMAAWLRPRLAGDALVLVSPSARTRQTAKPLERPFETAAGVGVGASPAEFVKAVGWPNRGGTVLVVGHQPTLGQVAALLMSERVSEWPVKKGAIWWLSYRGPGETILKAVLAPDMLDS